MVRKISKQIIEHGVDEQGSLMATQKTPSSSIMAQLREIEEQQRFASVSDADVRRQLNALAVTSHFVTALIRHPGPMGKHEEVVLSAKSMMKSAQDVTASLLTTLGMSNVPWAKFKIMRMVSEAVASRWRASSKEGHATAQVADMMPVWHALANMDAPPEVFDAPADDEGTARQIAVLDAMGPVLREIEVFDMFHNPTEAAIYARDRILAATDSAVGAMIGEGAGDHSRRMLNGALMRNGGTLYASAWRRNAEDLLDYLRTLAPQEQNEIVSAHPNGFSLDKVDASFHDAFSKLTDMVQYLAPTRVPKNENENNATSEDSASISDTSASHDAMSSDLTPADYADNDDHSDHAHAEQSESGFMHQQAEHYSPSESKEFDGGISTNISVTTAKQGFVQNAES